MRSRSNVELHDLYFKARNEGLRVILGLPPRYRWLFYKLLWMNGKTRIKLS